MQTLRRDLQRVRNDLGDLANALYDVGRGSADSARSQVNDRIRTISNAYRHARQRGDQVIDTLTERPMTAMVGAFAIGLVLAGLLAMASMMRRT